VPIVVFLLGAAALTAFIAVGLSVNRQPAAETAKVAAASVPPRGALPNHGEEQHGAPAAWVDEKAPPQGARQVDAKPPAAGKPIPPLDEQPVRTNGQPTNNIDELMMCLQNQLGFPERPPPKEVLEYYKDIRKPRFYRGKSWKFRPPTAQEQQAVIRYWARQPKASTLDEFVEWYLACVSGIKDGNDEIGQQRTFQVRIAARTYCFMMDSSGQVYAVVDL
jgi:hypothetical protein